MGCDQYDWRSVTQTLPAVGGSASVFPANQNRVCIMFAGPVAATITVSNRQIAAGGVTWINMNLNQLNVLPYRNFGPLIRDDIFIGTLAGAGTFTATEIFIVPR